MPKLLEIDQKMLFKLLICYRDCFEKANKARFANDHQKANWYMREVERCSRDLDEIMSRYI